MRPALVLALVAYAAVFAVLCIDTMVRVWSVRAAFDTMFDVGVLLLYEGMRVLTVVAGVALAGAAAARAGRSRHAAGVAVLIVLLLIAYAKATAYSGFPGFVQERIAQALLAAGWSQELLSVVFGEPVWALMLAAAACLRLAVSYPRDATPEAVISAGNADRSGMMRGVALAGLDVGALTRRACAGALGRGLLCPVPVWSIALGAAIGQHFTDGAVWLVLVATMLVAPVALAIPALRAGLSVADAVERARVLWFVEAAIVAAFALVVGGILSAVPGGLLGGVSFVLLAVVPMVVLLCAATALAPAGSVEPGEAIRVTAHWGATAVLVVAVVAVSDAVLLEVLEGRSAVRALIALIVAGGLATPVHAALRAPAARLVPASLRTAAADR